MQRAEGRNAFADAACTHERGHLLGNVDDLSAVLARDLEGFRVDDEVPGLSETANLFVPFYTTKPGGSGIGLVLSRQIAEGHGGGLELENRPERNGARARLKLPTA